MSEDDSRDSKASLLFESKNKFSSAKDYYTNSIHEVNRSRYLAQLKLKTGFIPQGQMMQTTHKQRFKKYMRELGHEEMKEKKRLERERLEAMKPTPFTKRETKILEGLRFSAALRSGSSDPSKTLQGVNSIRPGTSQADLGRKNQTVSQSREGG